MKKIIAVLLSLFVASPVFASPLNLDPYFSFGSSSIDVSFAGNTDTSPSYFVAAGTTLNWISPNLGAEIRFGFGGQYHTFNGDISMYSQYLLKPGFAVTQNFDLYALGGLTTMKVNVGNTSFTDTAASYGAGLRYHIPDESLSLMAEWMNFRTSTSQSTTTIDGMDVNSAAIGITFSY